jgi:subtilase family serine protease
VTISSRAAMFVAALLATAVAVAVPQAATAGTPTVRQVCGAVPAGVARCMAEVRTDVHGGKGVRGPAAHLADTTLPGGYSPTDLRAAYDLPATGGAGQTVGIVDAGDDATVEADLAVYRQTYGVPACTTANGCFRKVNQAGASSPLPPDAGWDVEIALDVDMVSAACPLCKILLVEANDAETASLAAAEDTAANLGATEISNSYGATEYNGMQDNAADYAHPGVAITVSSGDLGYGIPNFPAVLPTVIAVGGTSLTRSSSTARGWTESAWNSNGGAAASGCSAWIAKPSWQHDANCPGRMVADVAADADPVTGPAIYDTIDGGWELAGGTSAAAPFMAGVIALAGNPGMLSNASYVYAHAADLNDVVGGDNVLGEDCGGDYQCDAVTGYDGPTGLGTPHGVGAF